MKGLYIYTVNKIFRIPELAMQSIYNFSDLSVAKAMFQSEKTNSKSTSSDSETPKTPSKVYLAGGCFWGLQELFKSQAGVVSTEVGYTGGDNSDPTYKNHPGHAEALKITYDEGQTNLSNILEYFFKIHDPTTVNRQGNDAGDSYRSAYFYQTDDEKHEVLEFIDKMNTSGKWPSPAVTKLEPLVKFYPAEEYHQDYLQKNPGGYTCHFERDFSF